MVDYKIFKTKRYKKLAVITNTDFPQSFTSTATGWSSRNSAVIAAGRPPSLSSLSRAAHWMLWVTYCTCHWWCPLLGSTNWSLVWRPLHTVWGYTCCNCRFPCSLINRFLAAYKFLYGLFDSVIDTINYIITSQHLLTWAGMTQVL